MATSLGTEFSTDENQVSQCDEQTFGSTPEFKEAGVAKASLAKSSKLVSVKQMRLSASLPRSSGATRKQARSASLLLSRTWSFTSTKVNLKKSSLGVV